MFELKRTYKNFRQLLLPALALALVILMSGCEPMSPEMKQEYREQYVVNAYLVANDRLPEVLVSTTGPPDEQYNPDEHGVPDAKVQVRRLRPDGSVAESYRYFHFKHSIYLPAGKIRVRPEHRYQLFITFEEGDTLQAETTVPGAFEAVNSIDRRFVYQQDQQVEVAVTPSSYPGRDTYYMFSVDAHNRRKSNLTPFYKDMVSEKGMGIDALYVNTTDITSASIYPVDEEGQLLLNIPWSAFSFYGKNKITVNALDDNLYQTWPTISPGLLTKGITLSPSRDDQLPDHITGGLGIFGSMARVSVDVIVHE